MKKIASIILATILFMSAGSILNAGDKVKEGPTTLLTTSISGSVCDKVTGEALVGVAVRLEGMNEVSYTDFNGNFIFMDVLPGEYSVTSSMISYETKITNVDIDLTKDNTIQLKMKTVSAIE